LPQHGCALTAGGGETANPPPCGRRQRQQLLAQRGRWTAAGFVFAFTTPKWPASIDLPSSIRQRGWRRPPVLSDRDLFGRRPIRQPASRTSLATGAEPQEWDAGDVVCRYVKLVALDGQTADGAALNEIAALGSLTTDPMRMGLEDVWENRGFASLANDAPRIRIRTT
jgi:hypothetical protein